MSLATWESRYPDFEFEEVHSPDAIRAFNRSGIICIDLSAMDALQEFRTLIGQPLFCNYGGLHLRGFRSPYEATSIPSARLSPHCRGVAFDITPEDRDIDKLYEQALEFPKFYGIGKYRSFIHVDMWDRKADGTKTTWHK